MRSPIAAASILFLVACGPNGGRGGGGNHNHNDGGTNNNGGDGGNNQGGNTFDAMCSGSKTTITGTVVAPNAVDPVANAFVYVPISTGQFPNGVACELCGMPIDGAITQAISGPDGRFTLDLGPVAPATQVKFTVNKGRFRRTMTVMVNACQENPIGSPFTQLPSKANPGTDDIPKIAVSLGGKDQLDVVLSAMGLDDQVGFDCFENRKTVPTNNTLTTPCGKRLSAGPLPDLTAMLKDLNQLKSYNMLFVSCARGKWASLPAADQQTIASNLQTWAGMGGRLFATDNSYDYVAQSFPSDITWAGAAGTVDAANVGVGNSSMPVTYAGRVNDSTMQAWLTAVSALSNGSNTLQLTGYLDQWSAISTLPMSTADMVDATNAQLYTAPMMPGPAGTVPQSVRFDVTPPGGMNACGRVIYTSYHTLSPSGSIDATMLSPQERVLEYLTLEAGACVGSIS